MTGREVTLTVSVDCCKFDTLRVVIMSLDSRPDSELLSSVIFFPFFCVIVTVTRQTPHKSHTAPALQPASEATPTATRCTAACSMHDAVTARHIGAATPRDVHDVPGRCVMARCR